MSEEKIKVISTVNGRCVVNNQDLHIKRVWQARGDSVVFTREQLEQLMYDQGFANMVKDGSLYIDNMEVKKEIGVEPEDAETPTIVLMDEKELKRYWKDMPFTQFKVELKKLTHNQIESLIEYAIRNNNFGSIEKANYLSKISGRNVLKGIELEEQSKEA